MLYRPPPAKGWVRRTVTVIHPGTYSSKTIDEPSPELLREMRKAARAKKKAA